MKILLASHLFAPSVGGIEEVSSILAEEFLTQGHSVRVVTQTPSSRKEVSTYPVVRSPSSRTLLKLIRWSDVLFQNNISLRFAWPLLFLKRPWVIAHHTWIARPDGSMGIKDLLKRALLPLASNISVSQALAAHLPVPSEVIGNPYQDSLFRLKPGILRNKPLVFLGRLVWDKGADLLFQALALLKQEGLNPSLTVIGEGPERPRLDRLANNLGMADQVKFLGLKQEEELVDLLNAHQILVAPSRWNEPFGLVALEGIACGCVVAGSEGGGLKDAIGPCGMTFPNSNVDGLKKILEQLLRNPSNLDAFRAQAARHLHPHRRSLVAERYLKVCELTLRANKRGNSP